MATIVMQIEQITVYLNSENSQHRLKALTELRHYDTQVAVPLLISCLQDPEFLVRSFVAMGLGNKKSPESYEALVELLNNDRDHNVRAEAANALSKYGEVAIACLVEAFRRDDSWLVRRSILAPLMDMPYPDALYQVCLCGLTGEDQMVREAAVSALGILAGSEKHDQALQQLLALVASESWHIRARVARALKQFEDASAKAALKYLSKDDDHQVLGAVLEN
ncbi:MAG: HEAT repeat domain-containing protein [Microcoleaceae cyanobacterium]